MSKTKQIYVEQNRAEILKSRTESFLEYERCNLIQEQSPSPTIININREEQNENRYPCTESQKHLESSDNSGNKERIEENFFISNERIKEGRYASQRYKTTCYFQPKQYPVKYSETVIVNIGSDKKHYYDSIYYMTKMLPNHWTESMETLTPGAVSISEIIIPVKEDYHYMSLELQQPQLIEV